jgi:hypothetical protein
MFRSYHQVDPLDWITLINMSTFEQLLIGKYTSNNVQFQIWEIGYKQLFKWFNDIPQTTTKKK